MADTYVTRQEIHEQSNAIDVIVDKLQTQDDELSECCTDIAGIVTVGCGSSYYLAQAASALFSEVTSSFAYPGSEVFLSSEQLPNGDVDVIVPISRSGESTETVRATEALIERYPDAEVVGVTCTAGSSIDTLADISLLSPEGNEESVVMTKSFSSMLVALEYLAEIITTGHTNQARFEGLEQDVQHVLEQTEDLAADLGQRSDLERFVFLGSGAHYGVASEAMLKLEELTLSWTKAYHPLEFRHGPKSIADENTLVSLLLPAANSQVYADLVADIQELGAETLVVGPNAAINQVDATYGVALPPQDGEVDLALYLPVFQLLGYHRAIHKELDPDNPKHLTQVVDLSTTEP